MFGKIRADAAFHESLCVRKRLDITLGSRDHVCRHLMLVLIASEYNGNDLFSVNGLVSQYHSHCIKRGMLQIIGCDILKTDFAQNRAKGFSGSVRASSYRKNQRGGHGAQMFVGFFAGCGKIAVAVIVGLLAGIKAVKGRHGKRAFYQRILGFSRVYRRYKGCRQNKR